MCLELSPSRTNEFWSHHTERPENISDSTRLIEPDLVYRDHILLSDAFCHSLLAAIDYRLQLQVEIPRRPLMVPDELHVFTIFIEVSLALI